MILGFTLRNPESKTITNAIEELQKIIIVMESLKSFLQTADPILFGENNKSNLQSYLNSIESNLQTYNSSPASYPAILDTIYSNYLEPTLNIFSYLVPKPTPNGLDYLSGAIVSARRSASQQLRHLNSDFEKKLSDLEARYSEKHVEINSTYEERLTTFETTLNEKQETFDESLSDSTQLVENLKQLSAETTDDIKSQKTRLDTAIAEFQEQFPRESERIKNNSPKQKKIDGKNLSRQYKIVKKPTKKKLLIEQMN